jgi:AcrR family transcriptional regulator
MNVPPPPSTATVRPRVEGDRELEILDAALDVLADVGYDRMTMDAIATRAHASKATLYRRWHDKCSLVIDALKLEKGPTDLPDTGNFRDDLRSVFCGLGGITDQRTVSIFNSTITALNRDEEFAREFRERVIGPKLAVSRQIYERALERGEVREDLDVDLFVPALAGIILHRIYVLGETPTQELVERVIDEIILPAATTGTPSK